MRPAGPEVSIELGKRAELAAGGLEAFKDDEQVFERARQTIELPHDEGIAGAELIEQAVQLGPIPPSARRGLLEYFLAAGFCLSARTSPAPTYV